MTGIVSDQARARAHYAVRRSQGRVEVRQRLVDLLTVAMDRRTSYRRVADSARRFAARVEEIDAELVEQTELGEFEP